MPAAVKLFHHGVTAGSKSGLVACQLNPWQKTLRTTVVDVKDWPEGLSDSRTKMKKTKKKSKKTKAFALVLEDTVLFPEGGGQPSDIGVVKKADGDGDAVNVEFVARTESGEVIHKVSKPIDEGTEVDVVVDWKKRIDHMQQHSAQHLISAVARERYNAKTVSWALRDYPDFCEIELDQPNVSQETIEDIERHSNDIISEGLPMNVHIFHDDKSVTEFASNEEMFKAKKLAEGKGALRVIEIQGVEFNTCCGTHLTNTAQLRSVAISPKTLQHGGCTIINFVAGARVQEQFRRMQNREIALTNLLSNSADAHAHCVSKLQSTIKEQTSELRQANKELIEVYVNRLTSSDEKVIHMHFSDKDLKFAQQVAHAALPQDRTKVFIFTLGESKVRGQFLVAGPPDFVKRVKTGFLKSVEGKGGGRPGTIQGNANNLRAIDEAVNNLRASYKEE